MHYGIMFAEQRVEVIKNMPELLEKQTASVKKWDLM